MPARDPEVRSQLATRAVDVMWAKTANWSERTAPARRATPVQREYWVTQVETEHPDMPRDQVQKLAEKRWRNRQAENARKAAETRRRNAQKTTRRTNAA